MSWLTSEPCLYLVNGQELISASQWKLHRLQMMSPVQGVNSHIQNILISLLHSGRKSFFIVFSVSRTAQLKAMTTVWQVTANLIDIYGKILQSETFFFSPSCPQPEILINCQRCCYYGEQSEVFIHFDNGTVIQVCAVRYRAGVKCGFIVQVSSHWCPLQVAHSDWCDQLRQEGKKKKK